MTYSRTYSPPDPDRRNFYVTVARLEATHIDRLSRNPIGWVGVALFLEDGTIACGLTEDDADEAKWMEHQIKAYPNIARPCRVPL